jgi:hypothetical protein
MKIKLLKVWSVRCYPPIWGPRPSGPIEARHLECPVRNRVDGGCYCLCHLDDSPPPKWSTDFID